MNTFLTKRKKLTNFKIIEKTDAKGQDYYIIFDNNEQGSGKNAYFCWEQTLRNAWNDLKRNRDNWKEIDIVYEEREKGNKVAELFSDTNSMDFLI